MRLCPTELTVAELAGWWLEARCGCRLAHIPMRLVAMEGRGAMLVAEYARRLRCRSCGDRPESVALTRDVQAGAHGHPSPPSPRYPIPAGIR